MAGQRPSPNRELLISVARVMRPMLPELTFVGGHVAELLVTDPSGTRIRQTDDVDVVAAVTSRSEYERLETRLRELGLRHDIEKGAPICRWLTRAGHKVDVMPVKGDVLDFTSRWYDEAITSAQEIAVADGLTIRIASPPAFLATKWEAYLERGQADALASHDLEDIITVVAGRETIVSEIAAANAQLRTWLAAETRRFLTDRNASYAMEGALPDARFDVAIIERTRARFAAIAGS